MKNRLILLDRITLANTLPIVFWFGDEQGTLLFISIVLVAYEKLKNSNYYIVIIVKQIVNKLKPLFEGRYFPIFKINSIVI